MDEMGWSYWLESFAGAPWKGQCQHPSPLFVRCDRCACKGFSLDFLYHSFYYSFIYTPHDAEFQPSTVSLRGIPQIGWFEIQGVNGSLKFQAPKTDPSYFHEKNNHCSESWALLVTWQKSLHFLLFFVCFPSWLWDLPWFTRFARNCLASGDAMKRLVDC